MVNIWNPDYAGNPNNAFYVNYSKLVDMDWKEFRDMYQGLHEDARKKFNRYLADLKSREVHRETEEYLKMLDEHEKSRGKRIIIKFGSLDACVA